MPYVSTVLDSLLQRLFSIYLTKSEQHWTNLISCLYFHSWNYIWISNLTLKFKSWRSGFFWIKNRISAWIDFVTKLYVCPACWIEFFDFDSLNNQSPPIWFFLCQNGCTLEINVVPCLVVVKCDAIIFLCWFEYFPFVFLLAPVSVFIASFLGGCAHSACRQCTLQYHCSRFVLSSGTSPCKPIISMALFGSVWCQ